MSAVQSILRPTVPTFTIQGQEVQLPVRVRDASSGAATFVVSAAAARRLLPSDVIELAEILPGRALCSLAAIDYRDNDLGDYNEISIAFFVRPKGTSKGLPYANTVLEFFRGQVGTYIHRLPVDASFTCEAGSTIWGFPKTVEQIVFEKTDRRVTCTLSVDGSHVLTLSMARGGNKTLPDSTMTTYTFIDGVPHRTPFSSGGTGVGFRMGGTELTLGQHPIADELRSLGLPKRAIMSMWMENMHGCFEAAAPL